MSSAARKDFTIFINTTPSSTATYVLLGKGISELSIEYNAQTTTEQDIISATASTEITGYQPTAPFTVKVDRGDPAFEFLDDIRVNRKILGDAATDVVLVYQYEAETSGAYPAEQQPISISIDNFGGAASDPLSLGATLNFRGDATQGTFNPTTKTFS